MRTGPEWVRKIRRRDCGPRDRASERQVERLGISCRPIGRSPANDSILPAGIGLFPAPNFGVSTTSWACLVTVEAESAYHRFVRPESRAAVAIGRRFRQPPLSCPIQRRCPRSRVARGRSALEAVTACPRPTPSGSVCGLGGRGSMSVRTSRVFSGRTNGQ